MSVILVIFSPGSANEVKELRSNIHGQKTEFRLRQSNRKCDPEYSSLSMGFYSDNRLDLEIEHMIQEIEHMIQEIERLIQDSQRSPLSCPASR